MREDEEEEEERENERKKGGERGRRGRLLNRKEGKREREQKVVMTDKKKV